MRLSIVLTCMPLLVALGGCHSSSGASRQYEVAFFNCRPDELQPYPCANLRIIAATRLHIYRDPDEAKFVRFRLDGVQVLESSKEMAAGSFRGNSPLPFLVYQEAVENIICVPGFNPEVVLTQHALDDVYGKIQKTTKANGDRDADYRALAEACARAGSPGKLVRIPLVPLRFDASPGKPQGIAVNHSMLVFLLGLDDVWTDLRRAYDEPKNKKAVGLICRTIDQMARAHHQKWPAYKWNDKQQRVIEWCHSITAA